MKCPYCRSKKVMVIDKRNKDEKTIRRRRECRACNKRFTTYERIELIPLVVLKKDGSREPFDRNKLRTGVMKACWKRPIDQKKIEKLLDEIESNLSDTNKREVRSRVIGNLVMEKLKKIDRVAYMRFASVYRRFRGLESFERELKRLKKMKKELNKLKRRKK